MYAKRIVYVNIKNIVIGISSNNNNTVKYCNTSKVMNILLFVLAVGDFLFKLTFFLKKKRKTFEPKEVTNCRPVRKTCF